MTTTQTVDSLRLITKITTTREKTIVLDALCALQDELYHRPRNAMAYAGMAKCKELVGEDPLEVQEYYSLASMLAPENAVIWLMRAEFAARIAEGFSAGPREIDRMPTGDSSEPEVPEPLVLIKPAGLILKQTFLKKISNSDRKIVVFMGTCAAAAVFILFQVVKQ